MTEMIHGRDYLALRLKSSRINLSQTQRDEVRAWLVRALPAQILNPFARTQGRQGQIREAISQCIAAGVLSKGAEVTFEESRAHLGLETQRQWSDRAIERTTPALFGLFSLVALFAHALKPDGQIPLTTSAWYAKPEATFTDLLALVRRALWGNFTFQTAPTNPDLVLVPRLILDRLALAACF